MNRIKAERAILGMTQEELAIVLGVDPSSVVRWESGEPISQKHLVKMRELFKVDVDWLLGLTNVRQVVYI